MPTSKTLHFDSARELHALYAGQESHLREIEKAFRVKLTSRDNWVKIQGTAPATRAVETLFEQLRSARSAGVAIDPREFRYILQTVQAKRANTLPSLWQTRVSLKKKAIHPKTLNQKKYLEAMEQKNLVFGLGPAGTGKTFLAVAMAVSAIKNEKVSRIILTRPAVEAGEALGFLPGDLKEKILPYLRPLYDALNELLTLEEVKRYTERGSIEIAPLAYMRGRTLNQAFVILDESQNTTREQMLMFLTRLGTGSQCVVTGDPSQIDLPRHKMSGLEEAIQALRDVPEIAMIDFDETDVIRHELVSKIISAYRKQRDKRS